MLSKRLHKLLIVMLITIMAIALVPSHEQSSTALAQDNTIIIGTTDLPSTLDPSQSSTFMGWEILSHLFTGLTQQIPGTTDYELALAESHDISEDGLTHTFVLKDATFQDGTPITAENIIYNIERTRNLSYPVADTLDDLDLQGSVGEDGELIITINRPISYMEGLVAIPAFFPIVESEFPFDETNPFLESVTSNGQYTLIAHDTGTEVELAANPDYDYGDVAVNDSILIRNFDNTEALRIGLVNRDVDLAWRDLLLGDALSSAEDVEAIELLNFPSSRMWYLIMNDKFDYLDDPVLRQNFLLTVDRQEIVEQNFDGYLTAAYSLVPNNFEAAYSPLWQIEPDADAAQQNLEDAGYRNDRFNEASFQLVTASDYGGLYTLTLGYLQSNVRPVDVITVNFSTTANVSDFVDSVERGDVPSALIPFTPIVPHPEAYLYPLLHSNGPVAVNSSYADDELDEALTEAAISQDEETQNLIYRQVQDVIHDDYSLAPMWQDTLFVTTWNDVQGITISPNIRMFYGLLSK